MDQKDLPKAKAERFDGVGGTQTPLADPAHGVASMLPLAILNEDPYPVKALITHRFDPMLSIPNYNQNKKAFDKLDFILTIDINFSETAWYSDVILPESMYLERSDSIQMANGPKPTLYMRRQCVPPRYDTKPFWEIIRELAKRLDLGHFFQYETIEDIWNLQLKDMGIKIEDFNAKGFVSLSKNPILWDRKEGLKFKTPSGKIEFVSSLMEKNGFPSFSKYEPRGSSARRRVQVDRRSECRPHPCLHPEQPLPERAGALKTCCGSTRKKPQSWELPTAKYVEVVLGSWFREDQGLCDRLHPSGGGFHASRFRPAGSGNHPLLWEGSERHVPSG